MNEERNFEELKDDKKVSLGQKLKKIGAGVLKIAIPALIGAGVGYVARKIADKDVYADAEAQRAYRERKSNNNN